MKRRLQRDSLRPRLDQSEIARLRKGTSRIRPTDHRKEAANGEYIWRLIIFSRLIWPSTWPALHDVSTAANTRQEAFSQSVGEADQGPYSQRPRSTRCRSFAASAAVSAVRNANAISRNSMTSGHWALIRSNRRCCTSVIWSIARVTRIEACFGKSFSGSWGLNPSSSSSSQRQDARPWRVCPHSLFPGTRDRAALHCDTLNSTLLQVFEKWFTLGGRR